MSNRAFLRHQGALLRHISRPSRHPGSTSLTDTESVVRSEDREAFSYVVHWHLEVPAGHHGRGL